MKKIEKAGIIIEKTISEFSDYGVNIPVYKKDKNIAERLGIANETTELYYKDSKKASSKFTIQYQIDLHIKFVYSLMKSITTLTRNLKITE